MSFKGALKYIIYIFIGAWMFLLGIMVGRGTSPVTFETRGFQERLHDMVLEFKGPQITKDQDDKIALYYYDALNDPVKLEDMKIPEPQKPAVADHTGGNPDLNTREKSGTDVQDPAVLTESLPVKTSKKAATFNKKTATDDAAVAKDKDKGQLKEPAAAVKQQPDAYAPYTIQVAAFKSFKDAVTQMALLDAKGFAATRTSKKIDGVTWYRVRVGGFATRDAAGQYLEKLNQAGISGMIIKKE
ncbi:MAG: SPOR domain-containing protein [Desulfotignum sp.]|nr:SPOR domain-containing protein [Desulfotignum sp.]